MASGAGDQGGDRVRGWLASARAVVVLTGSGVSAESRIPTFRAAAAGLGGENGPAGASSGAADHDAEEEDMAALWAEFDPQTLATPEAYARDPETVSRWYDWRRVKCLRAEPNAGHAALARMQDALEARGGTLALLTQNVDGLHQRAGSRGVVELHGSIHAWRGVGSGRPARPGVEITDEPFAAFPPRLADGEAMRPGVVWFGEALPEAALAASYAALESCDVFFSVGTSSQVWPAAGFVEIARAAGARTVEVNPEATAASGVCDAALRGPSGAVLPRLVD